MAPQPAWRLARTNVCASGSKKDNREERISSAMPACAKRPKTSQLQPGYKLIVACLVNANTGITRRLSRALSATAARIPRRAGAPSPTARAEAINDRSKNSRSMPSGRDNEQTYQEAGFAAVASWRSPSIEVRQRSRADPPRASASRCRRTVPSLRGQWVSHGYLLGFTLRVLGSAVKAHRSAPFFFSILPHAQGCLGRCREERPRSLSAFVGHEIG